MNHPEGHRLHRVQTCVLRYLWSRIQCGTYPREAVPHALWQGQALPRASHWVARSTKQNAERACMASKMSSHAHRSESPRSGCLDGLDRQTLAWLRRERQAPLVPPRGSLQTYLLVSCKRRLLQGKSPHLQASVFHRAMPPTLTPLPIIQRTPSRRRAIYHQEVRP